MLLELNFTLIVFAISFLIFVNLLNLTLFKPVGEVIDKRKGLVDNDLNKASSLALEAQENIQSYQSQIKQARIDSQNIVHEGVKQAEKFKQEKISALISTLVKDKEDAIKKLREEEKNVMAKLDTEIKSLTELITSQILGKEKDFVGSRK